MNDAFETVMSKVPFVAVLRGIRPGEAVAVGQVLAASGFRIIQIPLTSPDAMDSIARLAQVLGPEIIVGAGTVRRIDQLDDLAKAGGRLMATPHANPELIRAASQRGIISLPGVSTPTEAFTALEAGAAGLKLFPADVIPPRMVAALRTVVGPGVPLLPTGDIDPDQLLDYLKAGATGFGLGSALYRPEMSLDDVRQRARGFITSLIDAHVH